VRRVPDFDELVGHEVPDEERDRLRRAHELLVQAGPPPELSPELEAVPWPEESQSPLVVRRPAPARRLLLAATIATLVLIAFFIGRAAGPSSKNALDVERVVQLTGTKLDPNASAVLQLGKSDSDGNWPMILRIKGLDRLPKGGYYDLYLTKGGEPLVLCGTFNATAGVAEIRLNAAYDLSHFDRNGWVVTRQPPGHHEANQIVLRPVGGVA
jgi:hypothetical protein